MSIDGWPSRWTGSASRSSWDWLIVVIIKTIWEVTVAGGLCLWSRFTWLALWLEAGWTQCLVGPPGEVKPNANISTLIMADVVATLPWFTADQGLSETAKWAQDVGNCDGSSMVPEKCDTFVHKKPCGDSLCSGRKSNAYVWGHNGRQAWHNLLLLWQN